MIKRIANIAVFFICTLSLSFAKANNNQLYFVPGKAISLLLNTSLSDTTITKKKQEEDEKKRIKGIAKTKKLPKPEKIGPENSIAGKDKQRPKRQRRPEGLDRPPEIPRRSGG